VPSSSASASAGQNDQHSDLPPPPRCPSPIRLPDDDKIYHACRHEICHKRDLDDPERRFRYTFVALRCRHEVQFYLHPCCQGSHRCEIGRGVEQVDEQVLMAPSPGHRKRLRLERQREADRAQAEADQATALSERNPANEELHRRAQLLQLNALKAKSRVRANSKKNPRLRWHNSTVASAITTRQRNARGRSRQAQREANREFTSSPFHGSSHAARDSGQSTLVAMPEPVATPHAKPVIDEDPLADTACGVRHPSTDPMALGAFVPTEEEAAHLRTFPCRHLFCGAHDARQHSALLSQQSSGQHFGQSLMAPLDQLPLSSAEVGSAAAALSSSSSSSSSAASSSTSASSASSSPSSSSSSSPSSTAPVALSQPHSGGVVDVAVLTTRASFDRHRPRCSHESKVHHMCCVGGQRCAIGVRVRQRRERRRAKRSGQAPPKDFGSTWTDDQIQLLIDKYRELGGNWSEIAKSFPGRTLEALNKKFSRLKLAQQVPDDVFEHLSYTRRGAPAARRTASAEESVLSGATTGILMDGMTPLNPMSVNGPGQPFLLSSFHDPLVPNSDMNTHHHLASQQQQQPPQQQYQQPQQQQADDDDDDDDSSSGNSSSSGESSDGSDFASDSESEAEYEEAHQRRKRTKTAERKKQVPLEVGLGDGEVDDIAGVPLMSQLHVPTFVPGLYDTNAPPHFIPPS